MGVENKFRNTGIEPIGAVPWGTHICQFYNTKQDLLDILVPFFKTGLQNNEFCMWVTSGSLTEKEAQEAMGKAVPNFTRYLERGQIDFAPYNEFYYKGGVFNLQGVSGILNDKLNQALDKGYDGMRVTGNMAWVEKKDWRKFSDYEAEINRVIDKYRILSICTYFFDECEAGEVIDVVSSHQLALIKRIYGWVLIKPGEALWESEEKHRSLFENMLNGYAYCKILVDENNQPVDFVYLDINDAFEKLTGLKREDVVGKKVTEVIPGIKESQPEFFKIYGEVALTGKPTRFDIYLELLEIWLDIAVYSPQKDYFVAVFENITERKRAEEKLAESEERFHTSVETLLDGFAIFSAIRDEAGHIVDFRYEYVNESGCRLNKWTYEEQVGHTLLELLPMHKDTGLFDEYVQVVETGQPLAKESFIYEDVFGGGQRLARTFDFHAVKLGDGFAVDWRDVTEGKQAEESLRLQSEIAANMSEGFYLVGVNDGVIRYANPKFETMFGYEPGEMVGKHVSIVNAPTDKSPKDIAKEIMGVLDKDGVWQGEVKNIKKDGKPFWCSANVSVFNHPEYGRILVAVHTDITERKQMEEIQKTSKAISRQGLAPLEERFQKYGIGRFSDSEIIELLLCHTLPQKEGKKLANEVNKRYKNLREFMTAPSQELEQIPGMSRRCILSFKLLCEVPKVFLKEKIIDKPFYKSSRQVFDYLYYSIRDLEKEVFKVVYLDSQNQIIETEDLFEGTLDGIHIYPREIEEGAIEHKATGLIFVHNHTSGDCTPSNSDKQITRDLVFIGKILQIEVLDHIIIGENIYYSFADEGLIAKYEDDFLNLRLHRFALVGMGHK